MSNSGKLVPRYSNFNEDEQIEIVSEQVPSAPVSGTQNTGNQIKGFVEEYFGRFWWLWIVVLVILKLKSK